MNTQPVNPTLENPSRPRAGFFRFLPMFLITLLIAMLGYALLKPTGEKTSPLVGKLAPDFRLETLNGGTLKLSSFRGRPVIVNFWASWCVPCRDEAPWLEAAQEQYSAKGLLFVGIVNNDTPKNARGFVKEFQLSYPNLIDPNGKVAVDYGVTGIPETFFVRRDGVIVYKKFGPFDPEELDSHIQEIMGNTAVKP